MVDAGDTKSIAKYLQDAADLNVSEDEFYNFFKCWYDANSEYDLKYLVREEADHFWSQFHERNIFLIPVKPDKYQLDASKQRLKTLARAINEGWSYERAEAEISEW